MLVRTRYRSPRCCSQNHCRFCRPLRFWSAKTSCPRPWTARWTPYRSWSLPPSLAGWYALCWKREVDLCTATGFHCSGVCRLGRPGHHQCPRRRTQKRRRCCHPRSGPPRRTRRPRSSWPALHSRTWRLTLPRLVTTTGILPVRENRVGTWAKVTCRVATTRPDLHRMRITSRR